MKQLLLERILSRFAFFFAIAGLLISCAAAKESPAAANDKDVPAWVNNPYAKYPEALYLSGVGSGATRKDAELDATGKISQVFETRVKLDKTVTEIYRESDKEDSFESKLNKRINITSGQTLKNITFREYYFSEENDVHYALAVLKRAETALVYQSEIETGNQQIAEFYAAAQKSSDRLARFSNLSRALDIAKVNELLNAQLTIISRLDTPIPPAVPYSELAATRNQAAQQIAVTLQTDATTPPEIKNYLSEVMNRSGFQIQPENGGLIVQYALALTPVNTPNRPGYYWQLNISLTRGDDQRELFNYNKDDRTISASYAQAKARILYDCKEIITKGFFIELQSFLRMY